MLDYQAAPDRLKDRVILVTGAGDGIGAAVAEGLAAHGATVVLLGRTIAKLEAVYDRIEANGGPQPAIFPMNLEGAVAKDYDELASTLAEAFGRVDGVLHNAAYLGHLSPLHLASLDEWPKVMQTNLNGPFLMTRALLPLLQKSEDASVVFTTADVARRAKAYWGAYAISLAGVERMMEILADEHDQGPVRFNSLDPGPTRTHMRQRAYPGEDPNTLRTPADLLPAYLYLLGPDSRGTTGQAFSAQD
ncbi:MAG: YciK family oxidoreductase [Pseudomonadota bacterium]